MVRLPLGPVRRRLRSQHGFTMVEALVALAVLGLVAAALLGGLASMSQVGQQAELRTMALSVARHQLERAKAIEFDPSPSAYLSAIPATVTYAGRAYDAPVYATPGPAGLQRLVVPVSFGGELILTLEEIKVDRNAPTPVPTPTPVP